MDRPDVEALLFRLTVLYPAAARPASELEARARVEEWLDSDLAGVEMTLALEALRIWKHAKDWPPSLHEFLQAVGSARSRRPALEAAPEEPPCSDEEAKAHLAEFRRIASDASKRPPSDSRPTMRHASGALVHR